MTSAKNKKEFLNGFDRLSRKYDRHKVFADFITASAISLQNSMRYFMPKQKYLALENEYLSIVQRYTKEEVEMICRLFGLLVQMMEEEALPQDVLGPLYMEMELGNGYMGQFFTPPEISEMMAQISYGDSLEIMEKPFITLQEPACGAGSMILAFAKVMLSKGMSPTEKLWVQAIDVHRTTALMCYLQMALWHVPGQVIVGNSLSMEVREVFYTPAHFMGGWEQRLAADTRANNGCIQEPETPDRCLALPDPEQATRAALLSFG
jgi:hypothetical protein